MRFLFTCMSGQSHFYNTAPLAFAVRDQGHEAAYSSALELKPIVEAAGLPLIPAGPGRLRIRAEMTRSVRVEAAEGGADVADWSRGARLFGGVAPRLRWRQLLEVVREYRPDAVVSESLELAGPLIAMQQGIAHFTLSIGPYYAETMRLLWAEAAPLYREQLGAGVGFQDVLGHYIDVVPPSLQTREGRRLAYRLFAGAPLYHGQGRPLAPGKGADAADLRVLVSFGTVSNRAIEGLRDSVARLSLLGMEILMTVGPNGWFDWSTGSGSGGARVERERVRLVDYVPLDHELPKTSVLIHHGGSNTMRAAIAFAVPSLVIPQDAEQLRNARWLQQHGLGRVLRPDEVSPAAVEQAVVLLAGDASTAESLRRAQAAFSALPSAEATVAQMVRLSAAAHHEIGPDR